MVRAAGAARLRLRWVGSSVGLGVHSDLWAYLSKLGFARGHSSAGRAPALQAGGRRFDPGWLHRRKCLHIGRFWEAGGYSIGTRFWRRVPQASTTSGLIFQGIGAGADCRQEVACSIPAGWAKLAVRKPCTDGGAGARGRLSPTGACRAVGRPAGSDPGEVLTAAQSLRGLDAGTSTPER